MTIHPLTSYLPEYRDTVGTVYVPGACGMDCAEGKYCYCHLAPAEAATDVGAEPERKPARRGAWQPVTGREAARVWFICALPALISVSAFALFVWVAKP